MRFQKIKTLSALLGFALLASACSWTEANRVEASYGDAVNSIKAAQVYDPEAAANPSADPVEGADGQRMEAVMEAHRGETGSAESASQPLVINVGN